MTIKEIYDKLNNIKYSLMDWDDYTEEYLVFKGIEKYTFLDEDFQALSEGMEIIDGMMAVVDYAKKKNNEELLKLIEFYCEI